MPKTDHQPLSQQDPNELDIIRKHNQQLDTDDVILDLQQTKLSSSKREEQASLVSQTSEEDHENNDNSSTKSQSISVFLRNNGKTIAKVLLGVAIFLLIVAGVSHLIRSGKLEKLLHKIKSYGNYGLIIITLGWLVASWPVPSLFSILALSAGFLYGIWKATLACSIGAIIGYCYVFFISRYFIRDRVEAFMKRNPILANLDELMQEKAVQLIILLRIGPIPGFGVMNVLMGATSVKFSTYFLASFFPTVIELAVACYIGTTLGDLSEAISGHHKLGPPQIALLVVEVIVCILIVVAFSILGKKAYAKFKEMEASKKSSSARIQELDLEEPPMVELDQQDDDEKSIASSS